MSRHIVCPRSSADHLDRERRDQSRVSSAPQQRRGVPCRRLIRDSARPAALALVNRIARKPSGNGRRSSQGLPAHATVSGGREKKNGEVNSPTPHSQRVDGPSHPSGGAGRRVVAVGMPVRWRGRSGTAPCGPLQSPARMRRPTTSVRECRRPGTRKAGDRPSGSHPAPPAPNTAEGEQSPARERVRGEAAPILRRRAASRAARCLGRAPAA